MAALPHHSLGKASTWDDLAKIRPLAAGQSKKPHRVVSIYYHPNQVLQVKVLNDKKEYISAGGIKEILNDILRIEQCYTSFFGIFTGTLGYPQKLLLDSDKLPEDISQFIYKKISFNIREEGLPMIFDKHAEELIFFETLCNLVSNTIVPQPDLVTQQCIYQLIKTKNVTTFWRLLNHRSSCISIQSLVTCQKDLFRITTSLKDEIMVIKIGLDLKGIHFFDMKGETLIMTWPWTTITNFKIQTHHTQLFMFDIVVQDNDSTFLRTIIVQTSACEYLLSVAKYILNIHQMNPEISAGIKLNERSALSKYMPQFRAKHYTLKPYSLMDGYSKTYFRNYASEGYSREVTEEINATLSNHPNRAYIRPLEIYLPEKKNRLPQLKQEINVETYKIYYYSNLSVHVLNVEPHLSYTESYINVSVATEKGKKVKVAAVKSAIGDSLNLSKRSLKYFSLFANITSRRIDILEDEEDMPSNCIGLCFRTTVLTWRKENNIEQWNCLENDDKAASLVFWEVVAAHGALLNDAEFLLAKFIYKSSICHILYALGSIVDLYYSDDCRLLQKLVTSTNIQYNEGSRVILSLDEDRLHIWDNSSGKRIISFSWFYVIGIRMQKKPKLVLTYTFAKGHESGYNTLSVQTSGTPFLFHFSKKFSKNVDERLEIFCSPEQSADAGCRDSSSHNTDTPQTVMQEGDSEICREMIASLAYEVQCYAKQSEKDSIWRIIERIEKRVMEMPSLDTSANRKWWSENLFYKAKTLLGPNMNTPNNHIETECHSEHVTDSEITYYQPKRWNKMAKQCGTHLQLLIEPRTGFRSYASFTAQPQQIMDSSPPPHLSNLIETLEKICTNGKQFLNCFIPTIKRKEAAKNINTEGKSPVKALNLKFICPSR